MDFITAQNRAQELTKQLDYHNNLYYNQDDPEISDYDYDMLMRELENIEKEFPSLKSPMSPTNRVGGNAGEKFSPVTQECEKPCRMYAMLLNLNLTVFPYHANMKTVSL